jgi:Ser/Thr protein kinase RdoA (MazF antagonist)
MIAAADLCPGDPLAPALLRALDPAALRDAFATVLPHQRIAGASIARAKYKPGDKALLSVRVQGSEEDRLFAVRVLPPGRARARYARAAAANSEVLLLESLDAVAWAFPGDLKIKMLPYLADANLFERFVLPELAQAAAPNGTVETWSSEIAHYAAEQSCTMRVDLRIRTADGGVSARTVYGKCHAHGESGEAAAALRQIEASLCSAPAPRFGVARIILEQERYGIQWQEAASGAAIPAAALLAGAGDLMARVGAAVAALHRTPFRSDLPAGPPDLARLARRLAIATALPAPERLRLKALLALLQRTAPRAAELRLAHGDLHPKNIFDDGRRITFIDFDAAHLTPPEHDVASFSAALIYHGALDGLCDTAIAAAIERWQGAYERAAPAPLNQQRLAWLTAYCLLDERLYRCLTRLKPGRREIAGRLLAWADRALRKDGAARGLQHA